MHTVGTDAHADTAHLLRQEVNEQKRAVLVGDKGVVGGGCLWSEVVVQDCEPFGAGLKD